MKKFNSKSCEEIMTTVYKPIEFVVDNLLTQGLYILAGAPKVGKSWLALDMVLWLAFLVYLALRGVMQTLWSRKIFSVEYLQKMKDMLCMF